MGGGIGQHPGLTRDMGTERRCDALAVVILVEEVEGASLLLGALKVLRVPDTKDTTHTVISRPRCAHIRPVLLGTHILSV